MSENKEIPTNEEIIEDLTKDLSNSCIKEESEKPPDKSDNPMKGDIPEFAKDDRNSDSESESDDLIDEEQLKDLELTLTDEERQLRRNEALSLKNKGNEEFKNNEYKEAIKTYTEALKLCPLKYAEDRSILYANRGAAKSKMGLTKSAIEDCTKAIELNDKYLKAYIRRAGLFELDKKLDECLEDHKKILELDPNNIESRRAIQRLPPMIEKRNEELKTEMMSKLKDLGNMFLRPFGLSTENFKLQQDPNTGGYSVNFQQNK